MELSKKRPLEDGADTTQNSQQPPPKISKRIGPNEAADSGQNARLLSVITRIAPNKSPEDNRPKPQFKVPKRAAPIPIERFRHRFRSDPTSPISLSSTREKILHAARLAQLKLYKYSPIGEDQIRLLRIAPGDVGDEICVTLQTVDVKDLKDILEYEALSYHWGEGEAEHPVWVKDQFTGSIQHFDDVVRLKMQRLYIKPNLYKALKSLRQKEHEVMLWVDAVCINQSDEQEKKAQVLKMANIYSMAERVCIWLGSGDGRSDNAMEFIRQIVDLRGIDDLIADPQYASQWADLVDLLRSSWFSRRWVIQELALANEATVHCGKQEVHWDDFKDAIGIFHRHFNTVREGLTDPKDFALNAIGELEPLGAKLLVDVSSNIFRRDTNGSILESTKELEYLVSTLSTFDTSDPRDTIHSLRNIAKEKPDSGNPPPKPDYSKNLLEVYTDFIDWVVKTSGSIDIICRHWAIPERDKVPKGVNYPRLVELPSWIQVISESPYGRGEEVFKGRKYGDSFVGLPGRRCYNASPKMNADIRFEAVSLQRPNNLTNGTISPRNQVPSDSTLIVKGLLIGNITWASDPIPDGIIPQRCLEKAGWSEGLSNQVFKAPDKLWRTIVADRGPDGAEIPSWYHRACLYCLVNSTTNGHINTRDLLESKGQPSIVKDYLRRVQAVTWNRVFLEATPPTGAETDTENLFGLAPPKTQQGDSVCIFFGCSVPCIIRRKQNSEMEEFEFIGEAYIYGKMDGEAIASLDKRQTREFRLV